MSNDLGVNNIFLKECLDYLYLLQDSGITNMFGAISYLQEEFDLDKDTAKKILTYWMENYEYRTV